MLQNSIVTQIITAVIILAVHGFGLYFFGKSVDEYHHIKRKRLQLASVSFFIVAALGFGYFLFTMISTIANNGTVSSVFIKNFVIAIIATEMILYKFDKLFNWGLQLGIIAASGGCIWFFAFVYKMYLCTYIL